MMITLSVELFAGLRATAGCDTIDLELPETAGPSDILEALGKAAPETAGFTKVSRVALDDRFMTDTATLNNNSRLAIIPPVSGG